MSHLFDSYSLKSVTLRNRIAVSPMCQYSSENGHATDWHMMHLGSLAAGGAGLVIIEATAVSPEGRISPWDGGLWQDSQIEPLRKINTFMKQMGAVPGIQLAHAGRKASARRPWDKGGAHLNENEGGWQTIAPSPLAFGAELPKVPKEMTKEDIERVKNGFVASAKRALEAGFEWLEFHFAHGYLAHSFYSPLSNHRKDDYGGSFENRTRFMLETMAAVRKVWPDKFPFTARLSITDWIEGGVTVEESIELAKKMKSLGLDLLDVSHGFNHPDLSKIPFGAGFLVPYTDRVRKEAKIPTTAGWMINTAEQANTIIQAEQADLIILGHAFLDDPHWPFHAAKALKIENPRGVLPPQYGHWLKR